VLRRRRRRYPHRRDKGKFKVGGKTFGRDDVISIDGSTGEVMAGRDRQRRAQALRRLLQVMKLGRQVPHLGVRTNADTPADAQRAREFGAEGIGLPHRAHVLRGRPHQGDARDDPRRDRRDREKALAKLLPYQRDDFIGIFKAMKGLPVTIRLLDPPLHEFLPHDDAPEGDGAGDRRLAEKVKQRVAQLHEMNPMLGHRGCRLCVTYPEILEMQVRAIVEATIECLRRTSRPCPRS
jgi:pyruvate,orthophosphate dikinase